MHRLVGLSVEALFVSTLQAIQASKQLRKLLEEIDEFGTFNIKEFLWLLVRSLFVIGWLGGVLQVLLREAAGFVAGIDMDTSVREEIFNADPWIGPGSLNGIRLFHPDTIEENFREKLEELQICFRQDRPSKFQAVLAVGLRRSTLWFSLNYTICSGLSACYPSASLSLSRLC